MAREYTNFPVDEKHKKFCDFMEYPFVSQKDNFYIYTIPKNHLCRFLINYENWRQGIFDKEEFIKKTKI